MRVGEAMRAGINSNTIYAMHRIGKMDKVTWGLYRLADYAVPNEPDFVVVAKKIPRGVICLLSALVFHQLTTQVPEEIFVMLDRKGKKTPKLEYPPVRFVSCSSHLFNEGIEAY